MGTAQNKIYSLSRIKAFLASCRAVLKMKEVHINAKPQNSLKGYRYIKKITKKNELNNYTVAIYEKRGEKFFIKTWQGNNKDIHYYKIINEYHAASILGLKLKAKVRVPRLIEVVETNHTFSLIYEYIDGQDLQNTSSSQQKSALLNVIKAFQNIHLSENEKKYFTLRKTQFFWFTFPIMATLAFKNNKRMRLLIVKSFVHAWKFAPGRESLVVAHRDLVLENIMKKDKYLYVTDFEQVVLTLRAFDISYISVVPELTFLDNVLKEEYLHANLFLRTYIIFQLSADPRNPISHLNILKKKLENIIGQD